MMRYLHKLSLGLAAAALVSVTAAPRAEALDLFSVWAQGHGSVVAGDGPYFEAAGMPAAGYGAELGLQILVLQVYADISIMGQDTALVATDGEMVEDDVFVHWNHLGFGPRIRLPLPSDGFDLYALGNVNFLNADYIEDNVVVANQGWQLRGGAGVEVRLGSIFWVGADTLVGYHLFEESPGLDVQARGFFRLRTTVHSGGDDEGEPGLMDPLTR